MAFNTIRENKILAKISGLTVFLHKKDLGLCGAVVGGTYNAQGHWAFGSREYDFEGFGHI